MSSFTPIVIAAGSPRLVEQMKMNPQFTWLNKVHDQLKYGSECGIMAMVCQHWMSCSRWLSPLSSDSLLMGVRISEKCRWIMEHGKDSETSIWCLQSFLDAISGSIVTPFRVIGMYNSRYRFMKLYWYENKGFFIWWKDNPLCRSIVVGGNKDGHRLLHRLVFSDCESTGRSIHGLRWSQGIARVQREGLRGRYEGHFER